MTQIKTKSMKLGSWQVELSVSMDATFNSVLIRVIRENPRQKISVQAATKTKKVSRGFTWTTQIKDLDLPTTTSRS